VAFAVVAFLAQAVGFFAPSHWLNLLSPGRPALTMYYMMAYPGAEAAASGNALDTLGAVRALVPVAAVRLTVLAGLAEVALAAALVLAWLKRPR
jgi:fermentation-respiration switch protein FrsA (DUF1100 family)